MGVVVAASGHGDGGYDSGDFALRISKTPRLTQTDREAERDKLHEDYEGVR